MSNLRSGADRYDDMGGRGDGVPGRDGAVPERLPGVGEEAGVDLDPAVIIADDLLLDALGRAESSPSDDPLAGLLAAWRVDLDSGRPEVDVDSGWPEVDVDSGRSEVDVDAALIQTMLGRTRPSPEGRTGPLPSYRRGDSASAKPGGPQPSGRGRSARPGTRTRPGRLVRRLVLSTAVAVVTTALVGLGVNHAGPASPLWPVAAAVYPDRSAVRAAEHTIELARDEAAAGRYHEARNRLDRAVVQVAEIRDATAAARLRAEIDRIRRGLPGELPESPATERSAPGLTAPPTGRTPTPARTPTGAEPPTGRSTPAQSPSPGPSARQVLPLPVPLLPSLLPSGLPLLPSGGCVLLCPPD